MTAKAVGRALVEKAGYRATELPTERTCRRLLNRLGFRLRRVQKTKPHKKIKETDAIFANVRHAHDRAAWDEGCLRISMAWWFHRLPATCRQNHNAPCVSEDTPPMRKWASLGRGLEQLPIMTVWPSTQLRTGRFGG